MVAQGWAYNWTEFGEIPGSASAQESAKVNRRGIWRHGNHEVRPWQNRRPDLYRPDSTPRRRQPTPQRPPPQQPSAKPQPVQRSSVVQQPVQEPPRRATPRKAYVRLTHFHYYHSCHCLPNCGSDSGSGKERIGTVRTSILRQTAQRFFIAAGGPEKDPHYLDGDKDGIACESLLSDKGYQFR